ncbi:MarR family winged helix-turn-helix transcriptional regulator [Facklamia sp. 7083-14-GEN3]|uniref:MarR family winged helix-turn-helix transcriptional regulator n=1 Tax=Facklamia sp. 7083-14-GEN3 TaxID=2973478 RepID=UPI00215D421C|nr:MarR family transcriptional regulator [Facklamia sp. 7083-14-GEN3]MCR8969398.1 MarR family transcriptional regulator [Facklamia sp. 7083-14-GEN3]
MKLREVSRLFYQLKLVNRDLISKFEKETSFSITRYELMIILKDQSPCTQRRLQNELEIDSAAVTRHLKVLEEKNYVVRERNSENNREVLVTITKKAVEDLKQCEQKHCQADLEKLLPLSEEEVQTLFKLLSKLTK